MAKKVIVRKYRCFEPINMGDDIIQHLFLINKFWNNLVEIDNFFYDKYREVMSTDAVVGQIEKKLEEIEEQIVKFMEERNAIRKKLKRKRCKETAFFDGKIKLLSIQAKELRKKAREARKEAKERVQPLLDELNKSRKEKIKEARQQSGLYWGNYNRVFQSFDMAKSRAMKTGSRLQFHRFDGSGTFTIYIPKDGGTTEGIFNKKYSVFQIDKMDSASFCKMCGISNKMDPNSSRGRKRIRGLLKFTIYRGKDENGEKFNRTLDLPVLIHRPLPVEDGLFLKAATLRREKLNSKQFRWWVVLTYVKKDVEGKIAHQNPHSFCAINFGWKQDGDDVRIATLIDNKHNCSHFYIPQKILRTFEYLKELQSQISCNTNDNHDWIKDVFKDANLPESMKGAWLKIKKGKVPHPAKFSKLVYLWDKEPGFMPIEFSEAKARNDFVDRIIFEWSNLRDKVIHHREDLYKNWAKQITEKYATIAIDKMDLQEIALDENELGEPNVLPEIARWRRVVVSISIFREWLTKQGAKVGSEILKFRIPSTVNCDICETRMERQKDISWKCPKCKRVLDQDINACHNLLKQII